MAGGISRARRPDGAMVPTAAHREFGPRFLAGEALVLKRVLGRGDVPFRLGDLFSWPARRSPGLPIWLDRPLNIAQAAELAVRASRWLADAGVQPGDRVLVLKQPNFDIPILAAAISAIGA